jgi:hypothetical protein
MRSLFLIAALALPGTALAQANAPAPTVSNPSAGPAMTPAPVPSVPPATPQTGGISIPPEQIAPADRAGGRASDAGPPNASPFSGAPTTMPPGSERGTSDRGSSSGGGLPPLSR